MVGEIRSLKRKKYQRAVNKLVHKVNKNIKNDWLWNGRFIVRQTNAEFYTFGDFSGALFCVMLECVDTKTGRKAIKSFDNYDIDWKLYWWINICITEDFKVWDEIPNPYEVAIAAGRKPN